VRGVLAVGRLLVQKFDLSARLVDRVGGNLCAVAMNRIQVFLRTIEGDELRVGHGLERLRRRPVAGLIDPEDADALCARFAARAREASDIGERRKSGSR
jgi:hypothetical protein